MNRGIKAGVSVVYWTGFWNGFLVAYLVSGVVVLLVIWNLLNQQNGALRK